MKNSLVWVLCSAVLLTVSGCYTDAVVRNTVPQVKLADMGTGEDMLAMGKQKGEALLSALQSGNYELFKGELQEQLSTQLPQEAFDKQRQMLLTNFGEIAGFEYLGVAEQKPLIQQLIWKIHFKRSPEQIAELHSKLPDTPIVEELTQLFVISMVRREDGSPALGNFGLMYLN